MLINKQTYCCPKNFIGFDPIKPCSLPKAIIERPKKGFQVPFGEWCKTTWRDYMEANLLSPNLKINSTLNSEGIKMIWNQHLAGRFDYSRQLFALLTLSLWMETYLSSHEQTEEARTNVLNTKFVTPPRFCLQFQTRAKRFELR